MIPTWKVVIRESSGHVKQIHECVCWTAAEAVESARSVYTQFNNKDHSFKATQTGK